MYYALLFQKRQKHNWNAKKDVRGEGALSDRRRLKWFVKFLGTIDIVATYFFAVVGLSYALEGV